ncbi:MAG: hypothetical protein AB7S48_06995 [Bacteroidales bacterium]
MNRISVFLFILSVASCSKQIPVKMVSDEWINPTLNCDIPPIVTDIYTTSGESKETSKEGLILFCNRMNERFSKSKLSQSEAIKIYSQVEASGLNLDESFDQPDPNLQESNMYKPQFKERISVLKINDSTYEIYYIKTGCGKTYFHGKFTYPNNDKKIEITPLEVWRASFPC